MKLIYRKDYQAPTYSILSVDLDFTLDETQTIVKNKMLIERQKEANLHAPLVLNGLDLKLLSIKLDGKELTPEDYILTNETLTLCNLPKSFVLETTVQINPKENTRLSGLYLTNGVLATQCEAEGFRAITYYPDHPDVLSSFKVTIHADRNKYPVLLSNGNKIEDTGDTVVWVDPFKKPSYLFALVAGDLAHIEDSFTTMSGRHVDLRLYCEKGKEERLYYAMDCLKRAMKWDEEAFGREYDLDLFNIVAISDFNAGAMENKSLNIFNDSCLLADAKTATDATFENVETTVAHEYFHNWSGDRVTARDWFNLSLKEGFTVYRDQRFSADQRSKTVKRIDDVNYLKLYQFPDDDGPLAHPVRPDSYAAIENFYTTTIYDKGAELIRMQEKIVGAEGFRKGCDLYFTRHDGQAVTIDDFVKCIEDANGVSLSEFMKWYSVPGRPHVEVKKEYSKDSKTYTIKLKQYTKNETAPFVIPLEIGLVSKSGKDLVSKMLLLTQNEQTFVFDKIEEEPVLSINRGFTAPITLLIDYTDEERLHLMKYDSDLFNRYEIGQEYAVSQILKMIKEHKTEAPEALVEAFGSYLSLSDIDPTFVSRAIVLPAESYIGNQMKEFDIDAVSHARKEVRKAFATRYQTELKALYDQLNTNKPFSAAPQEAGKRALKNVALGYLSLLPAYSNLAQKQYQSATNLTDQIAALSALINNHLPYKEEALKDFYETFKKDAIVINRWLALQAFADGEDVLENVKALTKTDVFSITNPNKLRSLVGAFARNLKPFHKIDGSGYAFLADYVIQVDALNPKMAQDLARLFADWRHFNPVRQQLIQKELNRILQTPHLSINLQETVTKMLA